MNDTDSIQPKNPSNQINALHAEICDKARKSLVAAVRIGELLTKQRSELKHGQWLPWVRANLTFSDDTARNYMRVFSRRDEIPNSSEFGLTDAYRLLAPPAVDDFETKVALALQFPRLVPAPGHYICARQANPKRIAFVMPSNHVGFFHVTVIGAGYQDTMTRPLKQRMVPALLQFHGLNLEQLEITSSATAIQWTRNHLLCESPEDHQALIAIILDAFEEIFSCVKLLISEETDENPSSNRGKHSYMVPNNTDPLSRR